MRAVRIATLASLIAVLALAAASCKKSKTDPGPGSAAATGSGGSAGSATAGSDTVGSGSGSDAGSGSDGSGAGSASAARELPAKLPEDSGVVLADAPGGTVTLTVDGGGEVQLPDGTIVTHSEWPGEAPDSRDELVHVSHAGKQGTIASRFLFTEIVRSPGGDFAMVTAEVGCGDYCHLAVMLIHGMAERWKLFEAVRPFPAWRPDGKAVAIGGDGELVIVELPSGAVIAKSDKFMSPAYAADGTLYVRNGDYAVFTFDGTKGKRVAKGKAPELMEGEMDPGPVPVEFGKDGTWMLPSEETAGPPGAN